MEGCRKIDHGETERAAVEAVYGKFSRLPVLGGFDMELVRN
jgi:hypothetical protein